MSVLSFNAETGQHDVLGRSGGIVSYTYAERPQSETVPGKRLRRLTKNFLITLDDGMDLLIPKGFEWDGASIPNWYWFRYQPFDPMNEIASLVHDFLYVKGLLTRARADEIFHNLMLCEQNGAWKAGVMYLAVRALGWTGYDSEKRKADALKASRGFFSKKLSKKKLKK